MNSTMEDLTLLGRIKQKIKDVLFMVFKVVIWPIMFAWKYIIIGVMYTMRAFLFTVGRVWHLLRGILVKYVVQHILFFMDKEMMNKRIENIFAKADLAVEKSGTFDEKDTKEFLLNNAIYIVIMALILLVIIVEPRFLSQAVFINIITQSSVKLILALGVGGIIILQGTDLSLGRSVGFAAVISASFLQTFTYGTRFYTTLPSWVWTVRVLDGVEIITFQWWFYLIPLLLAMLVSGFFSMINGFVVSVFKVHPFLATLGASVALYGILSMYFSSGDPGPNPIGGLDPYYTNLVIGKVNIFGMELPVLIFYAIAVVIVMWVIWNKTTFGKNMYAVGGNPEAAKISGVSVVKTTVMVYILAGMLYGLGGYLEVARIGSASNVTGQNYELDAIAACVVGGISFSGGIGKISGAIAGVLMFTVISYGMNFLAIDVFYQYIVKGVIIVLAVALDTRKYIKKT